MRIHVHTGYLSADNGAYAPLTQFSDLATLLGAEKYWGNQYGQDSLEVPEELVPMAQELLNEAKMLYRLEGDQCIWRNVQSETVRKRLQPYEHAPVQS